MALTPIVESDRIGLNNFFKFLHDNFSGGVPWPSIAFGDILQAASGGGATPGVTDPYTPASGTFTVNGATSSVGVIYPSGTNPANTLAYTNYDGTNLNISLGSGAGFFNFKIGGTTKFQVNNNGNPIIAASGGGYFFANVNRAMKESGVGTGITWTAASGDVYVWQINGSTVLDWGQTSATTLTAAGVMTASGLSWGNGSQQALTSYAGGAKLLIQNNIGASFFQIQPNIGDSATAVAFVVNNATTLATAGAKLASFQNNGSEKAFFDKLGAVCFDSGGAPPSSAFGVGADTNNLYLGVPTGKALQMLVAGSSVFGLSSTGQLSSYGAVATAGVGVGSIRASGSLLATSTTAATVVTFTPGATGFYRISHMMDVTAYTSGSIGANLTWTDGNSNTHTNAALAYVSSTGTINSGLAATGFESGVSQTIWVKTGTVITMTTAFTGTATADFFAIIEQVG